MIIFALINIIIHSHQYSSCIKIEMTNIKQKKTTVGINKFFNYLYKLHDYILYM